MREKKHFKYSKSNIYCKKEHIVVSPMIINKIKYSVDELFYWKVWTHQRCGAGAEKPPYFGGAGAGAVIFVKKRLRLRTS